jgi:hypothetical protein
MPLTWLPLSSDTFSALDVLHDWHQAHPREEA